MSDTANKPSLHVVLKKEDIDPSLLTGKVAFVLDILCATSSISAALANHTKRVIPALNGDQAIRIANTLPPDEYALAGELNAETLQGFSSATPISIMQHQQATLVYATTNGTVALLNSQTAQAVYAVSLLNAKAVITHALERYPDTTFIIVCSGSRNSFNMEDFYGAGYLISLLPREQFTLTDSATAAWQYYLGADVKDCLYNSRVGKRLIAKGEQKEVDFIAQKDIYSVVPQLTNGILIDVA
ncbi:MAG: 2-phosphosulfolactate phosphatase [Pelistega sp.]|nr:2-phosphosulfolactate phosphatase [Pelistega sp.]